MFVSGEVISSRRGELSIMVRGWEIASISMSLPNFHNELGGNAGALRYLDLIAPSRRAATCSTAPPPSRASATPSPRRQTPMLR